MLALNVTHPKLPIYLNENCCLTFVLGWIASVRVEFDLQWVLEGFFLHMLIHLGLFVIGIILLSNRVQNGLFAYFFGFCIDDTELYILWRTSGCFIDENMPPWLEVSYRVGRQKLQCAGSL